jgi:hypothetical protein
VFMGFSYSCSCGKMGASAATLWSQPSLFSFRRMKRATRQFNPAPGFKVQLCNELACIWGYHPQLSCQYPKVSSNS